MKLMGGWFASRTRTHDFILGLIILICLFGAEPLMLMLGKLQVYLMGGIITNSSGTMHYQGTPIRTLSVRGQRWNTWNSMEIATAYHALILLPTIYACEIANQSTSNGYQRTETLKWLIWKGPEDTRRREARFEAYYNAVHQTVSIDQTTYNLRSGNLFVARFDWNDKPIVTQLSSIVNGDVKNGDIIEIFKPLLHGDEIAQRLIDMRDNSVKVPWDCSQIRQ
jgi:hypothetical protein